MLREQTWILKGLVLPEDDVNHPQVCPPPCFEPLLIPTLFPTEKKKFPLSAVGSTLDSWLRI